jgi:hypothetical protein
MLATRRLVLGASAFDPNRVDVKEHAATFALSLRLPQQISKTNEQAPGPVADRFTHREANLGQYALCCYVVDRMWPIAKWQVRSVRGRKLAARSAFSDWPVPTEAV